MLEIMRMVGVLAFIVSCSEQSQPKIASLCESLRDDFVESEVIFTGIYRTNGANYGLLQDESCQDIVYDIIVDDRAQAEFEPIRVAAANNLALAKETRVRLTARGHIERTSNRYGTARINDVIRFELLP